MPITQKKPAEGLRGTPDEIIPPLVKSSPRADPNYPEPFEGPGFLDLHAIKGGSTMPTSPAGTRAGLSSLFGGSNFVPQGAVSAMSSPTPVTDTANSAANQSMVSEMMREFSTPIDSSILRAGLTPVSTGASTSVVPASLTRPVAPFQERPFNRERVVGAGNARARGIGNAITGVTNAVGHIVQAKKQMDQDKLSVSMQRLLQSQTAINQAKQFLEDPDIDPSRKQALEASVERNQKVMGTILDDKKMRGDIEKGLNISFTDPSKNKTDQHSGVQEGIKSFREQFEEQMPQTLGPDPMAQMKMEEAFKSQQAGQKFMAAMIPRMMSAKSAEEREIMREHHDDFKQMRTQIYGAQKLAQQFANSKELAGIRHTYRLDEIGAQIQQAGQKAMELFQNEKLDPAVLFEQSQKFYAQIAGAESKLTGAQGSAITAIATLQAAMGKETDAAAKKGIQAQIDQMTAFQKNLDLQMSNLQAFKGRYTNVMTNLQKLSSGQAPDSGGQHGPGTSADSTSVTGAGDSFDPRTLLYGVPFSSGGALPAADSSDDSDDSEQESDDD